MDVMPITFMRIVMTTTNIQYRMSWTIGLIKPDALSRNMVGAVLTGFEKHDLKLVEIHLRPATKAILEEHYTIHKGKEFFPKLIEAMENRMIIALKLLTSSHNAVELGRRAVADIRDAYTMYVDGPRNLVHASDSNEEAVRESKIWFCN